MFDIENIFTYHSPTENQKARYMILRDKAKAFGHSINGACPESREKSLALTKLQEAVMFASASIAINEKGE